jgi:hypothetical protein
MRRRCCCTPPGCNATFTATFIGSIGVNRWSFLDTSPGVGSRLWEFGDGATSTLQNPTHLYANASCRTVKLTITRGAIQCFTTKLVCGIADCDYCDPDETPAEVYLSIPSATYVQPAFLGTNVCKAICDGVPGTYLLTSPFGCVWSATFDRGICANCNPNGSGKTQRLSLSATITQTPPRPGDPPGTYVRANVGLSNITQNDSERCSQNSRIYSKFLDSSVLPAASPNCRGVHSLSLRSLAGFDQVGYCDFPSTITVTIP